MSETTWEPWEKTPPAGISYNGKRTFWFGRWGYHLLPEGLGDRAIADHDLARQVREITETDGPIQDLLIDWKSSWLAGEGMRRNYLEGEAKWKAKLGGLARRSEVWRGGHRLLEGYVAMLARCDDLRPGEAALVREFAALRTTTETEEA